MVNRIKGLIFFLYALARRDARPKVVFYHDVGTEWTPMGTPRQMFWAHMKQLRRNDVVCLDDGFRGVWDEREKFKAMGLRPRISIAPRLVGTEGYLNWKELQVLHRDYGFSIICHGWSHQTLVGPMIDESPKEERTESWYQRELVESRERIAAEIGTEVNELCFPVGYFSDELIERCKAAGYKKVYASYPGNVCDDFVQPRCIAQDLGVIGFWAMLRGGMNVFKGRYYRAHKRDC